MGAARYRTKTSLQTFKGREVWENNPELWNVSHSCNTVPGQETWDSKNGWTGGSGPGWDVGGDFTSANYEFFASPVKVDWRVPHSAAPRYTGDLLPLKCDFNSVTGSGLWETTSSTVLPSSDHDLVVRGTQAISRCAPTNSHADLAVTLGELYRDGLPALTGLTAAKRPKAPSGYAGEYLNHEFGVKPFISDLKKLASAVSESERILAQYYRDSGRAVRRRYSFPSETWSNRWTHQSTVTCWPSLHWMFWSRQHGDVVATESVERRTWFSGAFMYHAKPLHAGFFARTAQQANHLLGLGITPDVLYNLTPWSWAADWFTNLGDVLNNVSMAQSDGLVLRYGYVMEEYTKTRTYTWSGGIAFNGSRPMPSVTLKYTLKRRRTATPFGFGLLNEDLTPRQWAIIAALGLSRGGKYKAM